MVAFDGDNKIIVISSVNTLSFHDDIYIGAHNWAALPSNMKYLLPVQGEGKASISSGVFSDSIYTMVNNWKLQFNLYALGAIVTINGTLTNGQASVIAPSSGVSPVVLFAGYTNATIIDNTIVNNKIEDIHKVTLNKVTANEEVITIYEDDGTTIFKKFDLANGGRNPQ